MAAAASTANEADLEQAAATGLDAHMAGIDTDPAAEELPSDDDQGLSNPRGFDDSD